MWMHTLTSYCIKCLHVREQQTALAGFVLGFFCQVQEPADEDEYEVCDNDGAYAILSEIYIKSWLIYITHEHIYILFHWLACFF